MTTSGGFSMARERDYDRYRLGMSVAARYGRPGADLYPVVVDLLRTELRGVREPVVLDVGCGEGPLAVAAVGSGLRVVGVDASATMLRSARDHGPVIGADAAALPVASGAVDAVTAVNVLDHLKRPGRALRAALRVLRPGGLLVAGAVSRRDSPELDPQWRPTRTPFDSEDAAGVLADAGFVEARTLPWDAPLAVLPDRDAVRGHLRARFVAPGRAAVLAAAIVARTGLPLEVTKRGALIVGRAPEQLSPR